MDSYIGPIEQGTHAVIQVEMPDVTKVNAFVSKNGGPYRRTTFQPVEHPELEGEWRVTLTPDEDSSPGSVRVAFIGTNGDGEEIHSHVNATIVSAAATAGGMSPGVVSTTVSQAVAEQMQNVTDTIRVAIRDLLGNQMTNKPTWQRS